MASHSIWISSNVRPARAFDLKYIVSLMKANYEAVGFLPEPRIAAYIAAEQVILAEEGGWPCGYLLFGGDPKVRRIYQACIQYDARRRENGYALVSTLIRLSDSVRIAALSLWCADDLEANQFWKSCGFVMQGRRDVGNRRGRLHNRWMLPLHEALILTPHDATILVDTDGPESMLLFVDGAPLIHGGESASGARDESQKMT